MLSPVKEKCVPLSTTMTPSLEQDDDRLKNKTRKKSSSDLVSRADLHNLTRNSEEAINFQLTDTENEHQLSPRSSNSTWTTQDTIDSLTGFQRFKPQFNGSPDPKEQSRFNGVLTVNSLPRPLLEMEYAVRGAIVTRAEALKHELTLYPGKFTKFREIIPANIGNPQAVGQTPITFHRQVLACLIHPALLGDDFPGDISSNEIHINPSVEWHNSYPPLNIETNIVSPSPSPGCSKVCIPKDVKARAHHYLSAFPAFGAYSHSKGISLFRQEIASWFERRDGFKCDPESIFLTDGASSAIRTILELLITSSSDGILIPVPQYPLYSASITRLGGAGIHYFLEEKDGWKLSSVELKRAVGEARRKGIECKAIAIINPGNPTGALLRPCDIVDVIRFCEQEKLVILADEVYQENVYCEDAEFVPFRKMVKMLKSKVELVSFHSSSKGVCGECGFRGGLMQLENILPDVVSVIYKLASVSLCANTIGQAVMTSILNAPQPGQESYEQYNAEVTTIFNSLKRKAIYATKKLNEMEGVVCQPIDGSMYAFPSITLPLKAVDTARNQGVEPDMLYCLEMLEETGIVCVPGSGFSQQPGTYHFRLTILPEEDKFATMLQSMYMFHSRFLKKYRQ